jgi:hypothetical protein
MAFPSNRPAFTAARNFVSLGWMRIRVGVAQVVGWLKKKAKMRSAKIVSFFMGGDSLCLGLIGFG